MIKTSLKPISIIALALATQGLAGLPAQAQEAATAAAARADDRLLIDQALTEDNIYRAWFPNATVGRKAVISLHDHVLETNWKAGNLVLQLDRGWGPRFFSTSGYDMT